MESVNEVPGKGEGAVQDGSGAAASPAPVPSCREVLLLSVLGLSPAEISEETHFPEKHIRTILASPLAQSEMARMEARLQKRLEPGGVESKVEDVLRSGKLTAARTLMSLVSSGPPGVQRQAALDVLELPPEGLSKKQVVQEEHRHTIELPEGPASILVSAFAEVAKRQPMLVEATVIEDDAE